MRLAGKTAFITAESWEIRRTVVEEFINQGETFIATHLNTDFLAGLYGAKTFALDALEKYAETVTVR